MGKIYGWILNKLKFPAKIREFEYVDSATNQTIYLTTSERYSMLHVGGLVLFFLRESGRFDGTCRSLEDREPE